MAKVCAVIMAGGVGTRFWPRSREKTPKQLLEIHGKGTMIQNTVKRLEGFIDIRDVFIVTNKVQKPPIIKQLPSLPQSNIIVEPIGRNTAACIGLAALHIKQIDPEAVMVILPADHVVQNGEEFRRILTLAAETAAVSPSLFTIGITPTHPETGYGYIQLFNEEGEHNPFFSKGVFKVKTFAEKPNLQTAEKFLASGDFLWNSGMFVWRVDTILKEIEHSLPDLYVELAKIDGCFNEPSYQSVLELAYGLIRGISIDYGVMEKSERVYVIPGDFGWSDIGSWDEVYRLSGKDDNKNCITGRVIQKDTEGSFVYSPDKIVATIGVKDLIIVNTEDALLVCRRGSSQDVKEIADYLRRKQMNEFL
jgi:mannose-1-phosphate guanylyltransferase